MDEKLNQAAENPVPATDQAPESSSDQAPTATVDQGVGTAAAKEAMNDLSSPDVGQDELQESQPTEESQPAHEPQAVQESQAQEESQPAQEPRSTAEADSDSMTMEDVLAASDEQLARKPVHRGMITTGTIIMLAQDGIVVDVGAKIEGVLPYNQLFEFESNAEEAAKYFKPGDEIQVYVVRADIPNNTIVLSKKRADQERAWNLLQDIYEKQKPVEVEIVDKVRGGLVANLGIRAFLPASQVDVRRVNDLSPYVNKRLKVKIIELNRKRNRVIVSRRAIIEEEIAGLKEETLKKLEPGLRTEGEVVEITDFGAFVNLGGIDGLVHRSELSHGRFNHPREVVNVGDKVRVEILDMDLERERINLSMKKLQPNPWENVLANYNIGNRVTGKVTNLTPFGAFVEIEPGLEGLIHVSEMSWTKRIRHPKEILNEGDEVEAMILKIDTNQQRISLGLRQTQPDPWSSLPDRFPPGTEVTGPITGITDFGVFMEIEEGIEGLVHISELAHEHIEDISEHFQRGDEVTAVILNIDPVEQRASLSRKRLLPFSAGAGDYEAASTGGAPANRGGAASRRGRRGGRRSQGIDYDYSYAATDAGGKTTTKLGDVYADLFAQFGLTESKEDKAKEQPSEEPPQASQPSGEPQASQQVEDGSQQEPAADAAAAQEAAQPTEQEVNTATATARIDDRSESRAEAQESSEDDENAIDAAEAAALLTAAFRQGKRPARSQDEEQASSTDKDKEEEPSQA